MKKVYTVLFILAVSCGKDQSVNHTKVLSNASLVIRGTMAVGTRSPAFVSLGIISADDSYELCGTTGEGYNSVSQQGDSINLPVVLPMYDSALYASPQLTDGDSLMCEVYADTSERKNYTITLSIAENNNIVLAVNTANVYDLKKKFLFNSGSKYKVTATLK